MATKLTTLRRTLAQHRLEQGLSLQALADAIGKVSPDTVLRFIENRSDPHATTVYAIERYLKNQGVAA